MKNSERSSKDVKQIRTCSIFFFPDEIYVVPSARTAPGFTIDSEPVVKLDRASAPSVIGEAVVTALNSFRMDVPAPDPRSKTPSPLLRLTREKSWTAIEKIALHVTVSLDGDKVSVMPTEHDTSHGGYAHRPDVAADCTLDSAEIGAAALRALEHCS